MNIASVCTIYPSQERPNAGVFVQRRLEALSALASVRVLKPAPWFPLLKPRRPFAPAVGVDPQRPPVTQTPMFYLPGLLKRLDGKWLARSILPTLERWRDEGGIDVLDAHFGYPEGVGCVRAAERLRLPVFITMRGSEVDYVKDRGIGSQLVEALKACTGVIAVSHSLAQLAVEVGVEPAKIRVIPNAVNDQVFYPGDRTEARRQLGLPLDRPIIIAVGQLLHRKGHHTLLRALAILEHCQPDAEVVIVGGPAFERSYPRFLKELAAALGIANRVHFAGGLPPEQVADWLRAADVFALPTHREGCCNAVLEALACGLPVVTTAAGDNAVYVEPPRHGFIVPVEDPVALADALDAALTTSWERDALAARVAGHGWPGVAQEVLRFFHERLGLIPPVDAAPESLETHAA